MPIPLDNFDDMAERGAQIIDDIVVNFMDGYFQGDNWLIPVQKTPFAIQDIPETKVTWITIEDNDSLWDYKGFTTNDENWNASGASLTKGYANCTATLTFTGTSIQYYAFRSSKGGDVSIFIDYIDYGTFRQENHAGEHGQYYVKIFHKLD